MTAVTFLAGRREHIIHIQAKSVVAHLQGSEHNWSDLLLSTTPAVVQKRMFSNCSPTGSCTSPTGEDIE